MPQATASLHRKLLQLLSSFLHRITQLLCLLKRSCPETQSTGWLDAAVLLPVLKLLLPLLTHQFYVRDQSLHLALIHTPHPPLPDFSHNC